MLQLGKSPNPRGPRTKVMADPEELLGRLRKEVEGKGLEIHPFKLSWYHAVVQKPFHFPSDSPDTLAVLVLSTPSMFERLFLPYLRTRYSPGQLDPLDQCLKDYLQLIREGSLAGDALEVVQDFELDGMRRPRVLVQSAGHVAGAAYYYQRSDVDPDAWEEGQKIFGVSVHPKYGGWFAFRALLIFHGTVVPNLKRVEPKDCVPSREQRVKLLEQFNFHWREWPGYRDIVEGGVVERYSKTQQQYFETEPRLRFAMIDSLMASGQSE